MSASSNKQVTVQYFAILKEERGLAEETFATTATTVGELYADLAQQHGFRLDASHLRVAVNSEFTSWQHNLQESDRVVFIPPVAGG